MFTGRGSRYMEKRYPEVYKQIQRHEELVGSGSQKLERNVTKAEKDLQRKNRIRTAHKQEQQLRYTTDWQEICREVSSKANYKELQEITNSVGLPTLKILEDGTRMSMSKPELCAQLAEHMSLVLEEKSCRNTQNLGLEDLSEVPSSCLVTDPDGYCYDASEIIDDNGRSRLIENEYTGISRSPYNRNVLDEMIFIKARNQREACLRDKEKPNNIHEKKLRRAKQTVQDTHTQMLRQALFDLQPDFKYIDQFLNMSNNDLSSIIHYVNTQGIVNPTGFRLDDGRAAGVNVGMLVSDLRNHNTNTDIVAYALNEAYEAIYPEGSDGDETRPSGVTIEERTDETVFAVTLANNQPVLRQIDEAGSWTTEHVIRGNATRYLNVVQNYEAQELVGMDLWVVEDNNVTNLPYELDHTLSLGRQMEDGIYLFNDIFDNQYVVYTQRPGNRVMSFRNPHGIATDTLDVHGQRIITGIYTPENIETMNLWVVWYSEGEEIREATPLIRINDEPLRVRLPSGVYRYTQVLEASRELASQARISPTRNPSRARPQPSDGFIVRRRQDGTKVMYLRTQEGEELIGTMIGLAEDINEGGYSYGIILQKNLWLVDDNRFSSLPYRIDSLSSSYNTTMIDGVYTFDDVISPNDAVVYYHTNEDDKVISYLVDNEVETLTVKTDTLSVGIHHKDDLSNFWFVNDDQEATPLFGSGTIVELVDLEPGVYTYEDILRFRTQE